MLRLSSIDLLRQKVATLAVPACEDKELHHGDPLKAIIERAKNMKEFSGKKDEEVILYDLPDLQTERVIIKGIGKLEKADLETWRQFGGNVVKSCISRGLTDVCFGAPAADLIKHDLGKVIEAIQEGACLANHLFDKYKKEKKQKAVRRITLMTSPSAVKRFGRQSSRVETICQGTLRAREWVNTPSNEKTPARFARAIVSEAKKLGLKSRTLGEKELKQNKMGALLAVAAGSRSKPRLVILEHKPRNARKTIALVGKGVTFDSGGLNIKTGSSISDMKADMSGAASVAATLLTAAQLKLRSHIIGVLPLVENMPSGSATRPGDIIRSYAGKTIEIGNTDAEGRLILIDAISYAVKIYKPELLIDLATLTGACVVALGEKIAAVFSEDDALLEAILAAAHRTHERCWRMPLPSDYKELLKSDVADINNMSKTRWGGAITAALFISEFVEGTRWAHIDIAGPAFVKKDSAYCGPGGTGFGVRLLIEALQRM